MKKLLFFCIFLLKTTLLFAQNNIGIDLSFPGGEFEADKVVNSVAIQPDGKILLGGSFTKIGGILQSGLVRLNPDGSRDTSFNIGNGFDGTEFIAGKPLVHSVAIQPDGKILVGGFFTIFNGTTQNGLVRLNSDGSKDNSFNIRTGFDSYVNSVAVQTDGKILVGGYFTSFDGDEQNRLIRLNTDGSKDVSFVIGTGMSDEVSKIVLQSDGKILVGGDFTTFNGFGQNRIIRLNLDGSKDNGFNIGTGFNSKVNTITIRSDGKILVAGWFSNYNSSPYSANIALINNDGSRDTNFSTGTAFNNPVNSVEIQPDGKIVVGGSFTTYRGLTQNRIVRLNTDGTKDTSFNTGTWYGGGGFNEQVNTMVIQPDGKIVIGGFFLQYQIRARHVIRLNTDGTKDKSFIIEEGLDSHVNTMALQSDGKAIVGGDFNTFNRASQNGLIRFNTDGTHDTSFKIGTGFEALNVYSIVIQPDGKILVGGDFTDYNGIVQNKLIRLNVDGTKDASFDIGTGFNNLIYYVKSIALQSDGKILVGGSFSSFNGVTRNNLVRLNANGSLDTSFNTGTGFNGSVNCIVIQSNGKVLVGGSFSTYNGFTQNKLIRLNTDGTKDAFFDIGTGINDINYYVNSIALQSNDEILVGGLFYSFNGVEKNNLVRLNANGVLDAGFNRGAGFNGEVYSIAILPNTINGDKILIGGAFTNYGGFLNRFVMLSLDSVIEENFYNPGLDYKVHSIVVQPDNKIWLGGQFRFSNEINSARLIRLNSPYLLSVNDFSKNKIIVYPNPAQNVLNFIQLETNIATDYEIVNLLGNKVRLGVLSSNFINLEGLTCGIYIVKVKTNEGILATKFIKE
jgi:uncharacterized delta-60 repeat protein